MAKLNTRGKYPKDWPAIATATKAAAHWKCIRCHHANDLPSGHVLTVHHFDGNKSNCEWWNMLALCQRCHLRIQNRVIPDQLYFLPHSEWILPYVAGFYAMKYQGRYLTRDQVMAEIETLLALENKA